MKAAESARTETKKPDCGDMKNVFFATSREIGKKCILWAEKNTPEGFKIVKESEKADFIFSIMYDKIFNPDETKNKQCFNFHPGILPEYKGVGINTWVLLNKENKTGATLHCLDSDIDTGPIIEIREFFISNDDTAYSLHVKVENLLYKMFIGWYNDLLRGNFFAVEQKPQGKNYTKRDLQRAKNLTRYAKAFYFPDKENAYYYNEKKDKIYIKYK